MDDQIQRVVRLAEDVLGPETVGSRRRMDRPERRALLDGLLGISGFADGSARSCV